MYCHKQIMSSLKCQALVQVGRGRLPLLLPHHPPATSEEGVADKCAHQFDSIPSVVSLPRRLYLPRRLVLLYCSQRAFAGDNECSSPLLGISAWSCHQLCFLCFCPPLSSCQLCRWLAVAAPLSSSLHPYSFFLYLESGHNRERTHQGQSALLCRQHWDSCV